MEKIIKNIQQETLGELNSSAVHCTTKAFHLTIWATDSISQLHLHRKRNAVTLVFHNVDFVFHLFIWFPKNEKKKNASTFDYSRQENEWNLKLFSKPLISQLSVTGKQSIPILQIQFSSHSVVILNIF